MEYSNKTTLLLIEEENKLIILKFLYDVNAGYLGWDITKTYEDIKNKSKDELLCDFIKIKDLVLSDVENKVIDLLLR